MREMITFDLNSGNFNVRVAAVILSLDGSHVLIHRADTDTFWILPGGRAEMFESAAVSIAREMKEELEIDVTVERLLWVVENFYTFNSQLYHQFAFYFLVSLPPDAPILGYHKPFIRREEVEGALELIFYWQALDTVEEVNLRPVFLRSALRDLPQTVQFVTERIDLA